MTAERALRGLRARTAYLNLCDHVRDVHGLDATGNAGAVELIHMRAHHEDGTDWHDAWRLPEPGEVLR